MGSVKAHCSVQGAKIPTLGTEGRGSASPWGSPETGLGTGTPVRGQRAD